MDCEFCLSSSRNWESAGFSRRASISAWASLRCCSSCCSTVGVGRAGSSLVLRFRLGLQFAEELAG